MHTLKSRLGSLGIGLALLSASASAFADRVILSQTFDGPGLPDQWMTTNNSTPGGVYSWSHATADDVASVPSGFGAQGGAPTSYYRDTFDAAGFGGDISDWLFTPTMALASGDVFTFFARTEAGGAAFADGLQVRLSTSGSSTDVGTTAGSFGDFSTVLLDIGSLAEDWTSYSVALTGLAESVSGRLAFRYLVSDTAVNGDVVAIDTVSLTSAVPEPATPLTMALGFAALAAVVRRRSKRN